MEEGEDFFVEYYNGTAWNNVATYVSGSDFLNDQFYHEVVWINETDDTFPSNMYIKFRCNAPQANDDVFKTLPGPIFEETQLPVGEERAAAQQQDKKQIVLVFFVGGVTYAEIAALRFLTMLSDGKREYIIGTTSILNGNTLLEGLSQSPIVS